MKRFYKDVTVDKAETGFAILLDGKPIRTPAQKPLHMPNAKLAEAIADEWRGQGDTIKPGSMALMQLAATAIDQVPPQRNDFADRLIGFIDTDLLCLREEAINDLRTEQDKHWQPPLDWLRSAHGISLIVGEGLSAPEQTVEAHASFKFLLAKMSDWEFTGVMEASSVSGSLVLALALKEQALPAQKVFELAELESLFQSKKWGEDAEAVARRAVILQELGILAEWFALLRA